MNSYDRLRTFNRYCKDTIEENSVVHDCVLLLNRILSESDFKKNLTQGNQWLSYKYNHIYIASRKVNYMLKELPISVVLTGSYARCAANKHSDLDLTFILNDNNLHIEKQINVIKKIFAKECLKEIHSSLCFNREQESILTLGRYWQTAVNGKFICGDSHLYEIFINDLFHRLKKSSAKDLFLALDIDYLSNIWNGPEANHFSNSKRGRGGSVQLEVAITICKWLDFNTSSRSLNEQYFANLLYNLNRYFFVCAFVHNVEKYRDTNENYYWFCSDHFMDRMRFLQNLLLSTIMNVVAEI